MDACNAARTGATQVQHQDQAALMVLEETCRERLREVMRRIRAAIVALNTEHDNPW